MGKTPLVILHCWNAGWIPGQLGMIIGNTSILKVHVNYSLEICTIIM